MYTSTLYRKRSSYGSGSDLWRGPLENDSPDATEASRNDKCLGHRLKMKGARMAMPLTF